MFMVAIVETPMVRGTRRAGKRWKSRFATHVGWVAADRGDRREIDHAACAEP
jgi:hypothetical protein